MDELKPCPFCGKGNALDQYPCDFLDGAGGNVVRCAWCHGAAPLGNWNRRAASGGLNEPFGNPEQLASLEQRARDAFEEWFAAVEAGDGTIPVPQSIADGQAWHEHIGRRQMAQGAWFEAIRFAALANQQGVGDQ